LGVNRPRRRAVAAPRWLSRAAAGLTLSVLAGIGAFAALNDNPLGGQPVAMAPIAKIVRPQVPIETQRETAAIRPATNDPVQSAKDLEIEAGVTVVRPGSEAPGSVVIRIADPVVVKLAPAPDKRLVERSRHGQLPRIGEDGSTSARIYARPADLPAGAKPAGRIAILIGGMGISQSATSDVIARLPGAVSLAFAPYGAELERNVARARADGHEVFLQVPMEPFDYPDNDPGPHTLISGQKASDNIERLHWTLSRFTGYVGIVNFMGGRFTADESALYPIVKELAGRGLMVVDDGSSPRSLLGAAAPASRAPLVRTDLVLDTSVQAEAIDRQLARLEQMARESGVAVANATALPMTVERIARWIKTLEAKGLVLVPVSSVAGTRPALSTGSLPKPGR
jgi:hypothetical protein